MGHNQQGPVLETVRGRRPRVSASEESAFPKLLGGGLLLCGRWPQLQGHLLWATALPELPSSDDSVVLNRAGPPPPIPQRMAGTVWRHPRLW